MRRSWTDYAVCFLVGVFCLVALLRVGKFFGWDEVYWFYDRIPQLYDALLAGNWAATELSPHDLKPGILPSYLSGIGLKTMSNFFPEWAGATINMLRAGRLPLILFNALMLIVVFRALRDWIGPSRAFYVTAFLALNPILISLSRIMNPDSTLWSLALLTWLFMVRYIDERNRRDRWLAGLFLGLTMLSKIIGVIFYAYLPLMLLLDRGSPGAKATVRDDLRDCGIVFGTSILVFAVLFPACWVNPYRALRGTIAVPGMAPVYGCLATAYLLVYFRRSLTEYIGSLSALRTVDPVQYVFRGSVVVGAVIVILGLTNYYAGYPLFNPESYYVSAEQGGWVLPASLWSSSYVTIFTLPLVVLAGLGAGIYYVVGNRFGEPERLLVSAAVIFVALFYLGAALRREILWPRYQAMIYPLLLLVSALFWSRLKTVPVKHMILVVGLLFPLWYSYPFYYHYSNPLNVRDLVVTPTWGFGGYEVAQFLNEKKQGPGEDLVVWSDNPGPVPFLETDIYRGPPFARSIKVDYLILSHQGRRGLQKHSMQRKRGVKTPSTYIASETPLLEYYRKEPIFKICLAGSEKNCMRVVRVDPDDYRRYEGDISRSGN